MPETPREELLQEAVYCLRHVRVLDCGAHYCRYCPAKSPAWEHTPSCPYVESQQIHTAASALIERISAFLRSSGERQTQETHSNLCALNFDGIAYRGCTCRQETAEQVEDQMFHIAAQNAADANARLAAAVARQTWQPIETAPKDGTRVLLYGCEYRRHWFGTGYYFKGVPGDGEGWIAHSFYTLPHNDSSGVFEPSHWMPMLSTPLDPPVSLDHQQETEQ